MPQPLAQQIVAAWNEFAPTVGWRGIIALTNTRRQKLNLRLKEWAAADIGKPLEVFHRICDEIKDSQFLQGKAGRASWTGARWDWIFQNDTHWVSILEGTYREQTESPEDDYGFI